ncbi:unnamed protein product [Brachionus calyciflorus]|uniref:Uncharacterized protein n=1 Tax=Brachionus calyciflorus TaxID=104777 RepID=A0A813U6B6_9BILA|nr:unnamed protein product [Brachionus calyciflorus]
MSETRKGLQLLLKETEKIGRDLGIKFNPKKTNIMIFNRNCKRTVRSKKEDGWQESIMFDGEVIKEAGNIKYLGYELDTKNNNKMHNNNKIKTEINDLRITEGNIIKRMIGVSDRCRTRNLFLALNITPTKTFIKNSKTEFLIRLIDNK